MSETCETCKFGFYRPAREFEESPGLPGAPADVVCKRYPNPLVKRPQDWCGEYQRKVPA